MLHRYILPSVPLVCSLFLAAICIAAATAPAPVKPIVIGVPADAVRKKANVAFSHKAHAALQCTACHHMLKKNPELYSCTAAGCHSLGDPETVAERKSPQYFRNAFHSSSTMSCNGCHAQRKKYGKPAGPTSCKQCHAVK